jgi:nitrate reductase gamma subunit
MTIFLVFPFTRLVHVWSAPVWYLGRPGYQVVRTRFAERQSRAPVPTLRPHAPAQPAAGAPVSQPAE